MGVWERSPAGLALASANPELQASFREALPDLRPEDVIGSPYCVRRYVADDMFGGRDGLAAARAALAARGVRLILDYVPNHVAPDHPWVMSDPELFVRGSEDDLRADPAGWVAAGGQVLAHGRDPYFPPSPNVVQLNAFSPAMRAATVETLADIASQCDGIRCDMAMLMINDIFAKTWGTRAGAAPPEEIWPAVIGELRGQHPQVVLAAEAYWDMEWELQQQGFDFCYDKRLYDRIIEEDASAVRDHLRADPGYQARLLRFLENHDEPRVASRMDPAAERAAAVSIATLPGATLWYEGQFEGRRVRPPVFLARRPDEPPTPSSPTGTGGCSPPSPVTASGPGPGGCSRPMGGPITSPAGTSWPGPGLVWTTYGTWWSSTCPASPLRAGSRSDGRTCRGVTGGWRTCCPARCSSVTAANSPGPACSLTWSRGSTTSCHRGETGAHPGR